MNVSEMIGKQFGRYLVLKQMEDHITPNGSKMKRVLCRCECGVEKEVNAYDVSHGRVKSCGCYHKNSVHDTMVKDLTGQKFGRLTVIKEDGRDRAGVITWLCECECGNMTHVTSNRLTTGNTRSCGCLHYESLGKRNAKDLTGKRFGHLCVLYRDTTIPRGNGQYWACLCDCGKIKTILGKQLLSGNSVTCGCGIGRDNHRLDLVGQKFGELTVIDLACIKNKQTQWLCQCSCGRETIVSVGCLTSGNTKSCGCIVSRGEYIISGILDRYHIRYETQKKFIECKYLAPLKFDFWLPDHNVCIEFDGIQHFEVSHNWNDTEEQLRERQQKDAIKTNYCEENDIILIRIPYWERDNIESILMDWLFLNREAGETDERQRDYGEGR